MLCIMSFHMNQPLSLDYLQELNHDLVYWICEQFFHNLSRMEQDWQFPQNKQLPLSVTYDPKLINNSEFFINPFLGYPVCPIIGRYNRGEYRIGQTLMQVEFKCKYNKDKHQYQCGDRGINLPELMHYNIRNIPEVIVNNKTANLKNVPDFLPEKYPVIDQLSVYWIVSFGQIGRDFLNYLNHMYILANTLFQEDKLPRQVHYLPIYAHLPPNSGLNHEEVDKGLNFTQYRGEYMSFHLNKGAPAFSPNNMRLGVEGGKIIKNKQPPKQNKKKQKYIEKQKIDHIQQAKIKDQKEEEPQFSLDWQEIMRMPIKRTTVQKNHVQKLQKQKQKQVKHQGFVQLYTSVLLENDYRIYYHWHIEDQYMVDMIKEVFKSSMSIEDFLEKYCNVLGKDSLYFEINRLLYPTNL